MAGSSCAAARCRRAPIVEVSDATGEGLYWRGTTVAPEGDLWAGYRDQGVPFKLPQTLADVPSYDGGSLTIPVNTRAERIYILGGRSTYDYGVGHWGDYEARADVSDRQFIGDQDGELEVVYSDGTVDHVPLIFGFNQWWWKRWGDVSSGGPFLQPFATTPRPLIASLHVYSLDNNPLAPSFWAYQPQNKPIASLRLVDNAQIQGFPLVAAITIEGRSGGPNATPLAAPAPDPIGEHVAHRAHDHAQHGGDRIVQAGAAEPGRFPVHRACRPGRCRCPGERWRCPARAHASLRGPARRRAC